MTEHNRDKDQENYLIDQARTIRDEIEVSVFGPSGIDTPPCAEAWSTAKLIAELRARVEALEAAVNAQPEATIPSHHGGHAETVYREGFHAGYKHALACVSRSWLQAPIPRSDSL